MAIMSETRGFNGTHMLITLLVGAAAGATIALLTAPRSGRETRQALQDWGREVRDRAVRLPHAVRHASERATHAGKEAFRESMDGEPARSDA
jgi:gas vesicle protein